MPGNNTPIDIEDIGRRQAPLGRVGKPQDIANGVLFLSMPRSSPGLWPTTPVAEKGEKADACGYPARSL
jgi:NAD(P)-dependent dehydrogenase (short-subunit alcohol dehydrogenase family)